MASELLFFSILTPNKSMGQKSLGQTALNSIQRPMQMGFPKTQKLRSQPMQKRQNGQ